MGRQDRRLQRILPKPAEMGRRRFLALGAGAAASVACGREGDDSGAGALDPAGTCGPGAPTAAGDTTGVGAAPFTADPFGLGVASGDPLHDRVVIWTRLVVEPTDVAASPDGDVDVVWQLSADAAFSDLLQEGVFSTGPERAHSVHVDVDGLDPDATYFYRFVVGGFTSPVGRTRTLPCADAQVSGLRIGFTTCQNYMSGWYVAQRDMAAQELDLIISLGDYIYESGTSGPVRDHGAPEVVELDEYRDRYGLYKSDPDLRAMHASAPFMAIWDDHEVDNNHAGFSSQDGAVDPGWWAARRAAAYRAWWEHMPVRGAPPDADALRIHRHALYGDLAQVILLDGRQFRDAQPCDDEIGRRCDETDTDRELLGADQEAWFAERLQAADTRWVILANPVVMLPMDFGGIFLNPDQWDGYPDARQRLLDVVAEQASGGVIALTGDIHASGVGFVPEDPFNPETDPVLSEFVVPAATSGVSDEQIASLGAILGAQPHIHWWDFVEKGWVLLEIGPDAVVARYRLVDDATDAASGVREFKAWQVDPGAPSPVEITGA